MNSGLIKKAARAAAISPVETVVKKVPRRLLYVLLFGPNLGIGLLALGIGVHDALGGARLADRITGTVFAVAGGLLSVAAGRLLIARASKPTPRDMEVICFFSGALPGAMLIIIQWTSIGPSLYMLWWLAAAAWPLAAACELMRLGARPTHLRALLSASVITAAVGLVPSVIGAAYHPVQAVTPSLEVGACSVGDRTAAEGSKTLQRDQKGKVFKVVSCSIGITNTSKRRLVVLGSTYSVFGVKSNPRDWRVPADLTETACKPRTTPQSPCYDSQRFGEELQRQGWSARFEMPWTLDLTESGYYPFDTGTILEPDQHYSAYVITLLPANEYNTAEISVAVLTAFADRVQLARQTKEKRSRILVPGGRIESEWVLQRSGWVAALVAEPSYLQMAYGLDICAEPTYECPPNVPKVERNYGLYVEADVGSTNERLKPFDEYSQRTASVFGVGIDSAYQDVALDVALRR